MTQLSASPIPVERIHERVDQWTNGPMRGPIEWTSGPNEQTKERVDEPNPADGELCRTVMLRKVSPVHPFDERRGDTVLPEASRFT